MSKVDSKTVSSEYVIIKPKNEDDSKKPHFSSKWWIVIITAIIFLTVLVIEIVLDYGTVGSNINQEAEETLEGCDLCGIDSLVDDVSETRSLLERVVDTLSDKFYINSLISILCPVISTILSVSISVYSEKIYGVSFIDLRNLDDGKRFSLLEMILIPIIILALCIGLFYFNLWITTLVLNAISLFYVIYFLCQEIPVLTKSRKAIRKMIGVSLDKYIQKGNGKANNSPLQDKTIKTVLTNMVYSDGLDITFTDSIKQKDFLTLNTLLEISTAKIIDSKNGQLLDDVQSTYTTHINNIKSYLDILTSGKVILVYHVSKNPFKPLADAIFTIGKVLDKDLLDLYKDDLFYIVRTITLSFDLDKTQNSIDSFLECVSNHVLISTLSNNQLWYVQMLSSVYIESNKKNKRYPNYLVYVSLYLYYITQRDTTNDEFKSEINSFIDGQWMSIILDTLYKVDFNNPNSCGKFLTNMLDFYASLANTDRLSWTPTPKKVDVTCPFDDAYIICWFIDLFKVRNENSYRRSLGELTNYLDTSYRETYKRIYSNAVHRDDDDYLNNLLKELEGYASLYLFTQDFMLGLDSLKTKYGEEVAKVEMERVAFGASVSEHENLYDADSFLQNINYAIVNNAFYYPHTEGGIYCKDTYEYKPKKTFSSITRLNWERRDIDRKIREFIISKFNEYYNYHRDEFASKKFDISYFSDFVKHYHPEKPKKRNINKTKENKEQYQYRDGSIKFNAHLTSDSICRYLTSEEIESIIQKDYENIDGIYAKKKGLTYENNLIFRNKESLINYIYNSYRYAYFKIEYEISYDVLNMFIPLD